MFPSENRDTFHLGDAIWEQHCPLSAVTALSAFGIIGAGLSDAGRGYRMRRPRFHQAHLLICHGGGGRVLVDGEWVACEEGQAYVSPARRPMAFETVAGRRWQFVWIYFIAESVEPPGLLHGERSVLVDADPRHLLNAIKGIYQEAVGLSRPALLHTWAGLVHAYVLDIVGQPAGRPMDPLWRLWEQVDARPAEPWTIDRLAAAAGLSPESLRLSCLRHLGRSPMRQVTFLRMRRADTLIRTTSAKLPVVARMVGYHNVFAFSTAFRRCHGVPPSRRRASDMRTTCPV